MVTPQTSKVDLPTKHPNTAFPGSFITKTTHTRKEGPNHRERSEVSRSSGGDFLPQKGTGGGELGLCTEPKVDRISPGIKYDFQLEGTLLEEKDSSHPQETSAWPSSAQQHCAKWTPDVPSTVSTMSPLELTRPILWVFLWFVSRSSKGRCWYH